MEDVEVIDGLSEYKSFVLLHQAQLISSGVPAHLWEALFYKLTKGIFDAGSVFSLMEVDYEETEKTPFDPSFTVIVTEESGVNHTHSEHIYLIDHAWTFRPEQARAQLAGIDSLRERMRALMEIEIDTEVENIVEKIMEKVWKYAQSYSVGGEIEPEKKVPVWYVMDEFGSRINHSDDPTCRVVPFYYVKEQAAYSLLFPIKDLACGNYVTRDFVEGPFKDVSIRNMLLLPWKPTKLEAIISLQQEEPPLEYFVSGRKNETARLSDAAEPKLPNDRPLKVFSQYPFIKENLKDPRFVIVEDESDADICWYTSSFKQFLKLSVETPDRLVNQFPFEYILTVKDLLAAVCRRKAPNGVTCDVESLSTFPEWLPTTFNLNTELEKFVSYFTERDLKGLDNHWICKPFNLARSLDTYVTKNLDFVLRLPFTGPKIAQKYVHDPVLFNRPEVGPVKFDIRYLVFLQSVKPLKACVYQRFWLRFANKPFELSHLEEYERHFTVMNYTNTNLCQMFCHDFIKQFEDQYAGVSWSDVEARILAMLGDMLVASTLKEPPCGIEHNPQSRALYAVDLMLSWDEVNGQKVITPKLLEVNFSPDCERACDYYPDFYDNVFATLFLGETEGSNVHVLFQ